MPEDEIPVPQDMPPWATELHNRVSALEEKNHDHPEPETETENETEPEQDVNPDSKPVGKPWTHWGTHHDGN